MFGMVLSLMMMSVGWAEIDLNKAPIADFASLEHIDQTMAESIVEYRTKHNGIPNVESLRVLNLSESALQNLREESNQLL